MENQAANYFMNLGCEILIPERRKCYFEHLENPSGGAKKSFVLTK